jgi:uncharacterized phage infection (PIP) family protein YhgE
MGKKDILDEINSLKKSLSALNKKIDKIVEKQEEIEKKITELHDLYRILETFPAKLNTTSFQITSNLEENIKKIAEDFESSLDKSLKKMDTLVDVNKRLDVFEEDMKAYLYKIRMMILELEDSMRR